MMLPIFVLMRVRVPAGIHSGPRVERRLNAFHVATQQFHLLLNHTFRVHKGEFLASISVCACGGKWQGQSDLSAVQYFAATDLRPTINSTKL
jgi:hypothetical protein